jgi:S-methylmethionine-dependent homocysteine/selenocysteine methylase
MSRYRGRLPQLDGGLFLSDGGIETTLIFHEGIELPHFAVFPLLRTAAGRQTLRTYYERHIAIARAQGLGFVLESPTWRASPDWGERLGYSRDALAAANREAIALMRELRDAYEAPITPIVISGCIGPRGDGYDPGVLMSANEAQAYHAEQIRTFAATTADMVSAATMTNVNEAIAALDCGLPVAISFTLETDGRLPTGQTLREAIAAVDEATPNGPAYYMINCAHPTHFEETLGVREAWCERLRGVRANASRRSHADEAPDLDAGDPVELGQQYRDLRARHPQLTMLMLIAAGERKRQQMPR